jgi:hypothetical protein
MSRSHKLKPNIVVGYQRCHGGRLSIQNLIGDGPLFCGRCHGSFVIELFGRNSFASRVGIARPSNGYHYIRSLCRHHAGNPSGIESIDRSRLWLLTKGKNKEVLQILRKAPRCNGLDPYKVFPEGKRVVQAGVHNGDASLMDLVSAKWFKITMMLWGAWWVWYRLFVLWSHYCHQHCFDQSQRQGRKQKWWHIEI